jgi:type I restriction enzyme S subunit
MKALKNEFQENNLCVSWIGKIPNSWNIKTLGNSTQIILSNADKKINDGETKVSLCNYTDVYYNHKINLNILFLEASATNLEIHRFQLKVNDVLITKDSETPSDIAVPSLVTEIKPNLLCGYHLAILRPLEDSVDGGYLFYSLMSECAKAQFSSLATGITRYGIGNNDIKNVRLCFPSLEIQKLIATFLDRKTAAIDTLIAKKQRLIQLLEEKRTALINQAVTKGLNPNVPMKDSGIPWIGKIPEHWEIYHLNRVVKKFVDYRGKTPEKTKFGVPLITAGAIRHGEIDHSRAPEWVSEEVYLEIIKRGIPEVGDLLFTSEAPLGEVAIILDPEIALAQRVILFKVDKTKINSMFLKLHFLSLSGQGEIKSRASGSTAEGIRADRLKMSVVPTPPLEEQLIINSYVEERIKPHKIIAKKINSQIEKLQEYRRSLITAAVTGKLNIKEVETNV